MLTLLLFMQSKSLIAVSSQFSHAKRLPDARLPQTKFPMETPKPFQSMAGITTTFLSAPALQQAPEAPE